MYYELYADTIFLVNFIMNLCLLYLVDKSTGRTATRLGLLAGGMAGAVCFVIPFLLCGPVYLRLAVGGVCCAFAMLAVSFRFHSIRAFMKLMYNLIRYTFLLGGGVLFITKTVSALTGRSCGAIFILLTGLLLTFFITALGGKEAGGHMCNAVLVKNGRSVKTRALIDSGNSLVEPISGSPAAVLDKSLFDMLWSDDREPFRVVPYHGVDRTHGILRGYFLDELETDAGGLHKRYKNVCVAVSAEGVQESYVNDSRIGIILNPDILKD
jgi:stage II sporulation protein GA (sporulation sigma-E factor processing peptidase)